MNLQILMLVSSLFLIAPTATATSFIECHFLKSHVIYTNSIAGSYASADVDQILSIENFRTTQETLDLPGNRRATNSTEWTLLPQTSRYITRLVGNHGDLIHVRTGTIDEETNVRSAVMQYAYQGHAITQTGYCIVTMK